MSKTRLFVIKQLGRDVFWVNSNEHSTGWNDGHPKQAFSPSELTKTLRVLIDNGWFTSCEILELRLPKQQQEGGGE